MSQRRFNVGRSFAKLCRFSKISHRNIRLCPRTHAFLVGEKKREKRKEKRRTDEKKEKLHDGRSNKCNIPPRRISDSDR